MKATNPNLIKILDLLVDGEYHDGTSIGDSLNITRAAVWKVIKKLEAYGVELDSQKGKGYRLKSPLVLISEPKLRQHLKHYSIDVDVLEKVDSTNDYLKHTAEFSKTRACLAETQTHGRGRFNRKWFSPFGKNIYLSLSCLFEKDISAFSGIGLVIGLAVCHAIENTLGLSDKPLKLKWPNDIIFNHKKCGGILVELLGEYGSDCAVITGIGLNTNTAISDWVDCDFDCTSLLEETGNISDRNKLAGILIDTILDYLSKFERYGFSSFQTEFQKRDYLLAQKISVTSAKNYISGTYLGVNELGHLMLKAEGDIYTCSSGDTSIVKS